MIRKLKLPEVLRELRGKELSLFTLGEFRRVFGVSYQAAAKFLEKYTKRGFFMRFKKGVYAISEEQPPLFVVANKLYYPSYISLESALSHFNIIPEVVYTITSVTTKPTREFEADEKVFSYSHIKKEFYTGYIPLKIGGQTVLMAEAEKALVDYLYFVALGKKTLNERLNLRGMNKRRVKSFAKLFGKKKINRLLKQLNFYD